MLLTSSNTNTVLRFPAVRQRIAIALLEPGVQKQYVAAAILGKLGYPSWPTDPFKEHTIPMNVWEGASVQNGQLTGFDMGSYSLAGKPQQTVLTHCSLYNDKTPGNDCYGPFQTLT